MWRIALPPYWGCAVGFLLVAEAFQGHRLRLLAVFDWKFPGVAAVACVLYLVRCAKVCRFPDNLRAKLCSAR